MSPLWKLSCYHKTMNNTSSNVKTGKNHLGGALFAAKDIRAGENILKMEGPIKTFKEAVAADTEAGDAYTVQIGQDAFFDPALPGRYLNHSCEPNAALLGVMLSAIRDIAEGEEITFDYSTTMDENGWTLECRCGSPSCRKVIEDFIRLPADMQERYIGQGIVQPYILTRYFKRI